MKPIKFKNIYIYVCVLVVYQKECKILKNLKNKIRTPSEFSSLCYTFKALPVSKLNPDHLSVCVFEMITVEQTGKEEGAGQVVFAKDGIAGNKAGHPVYRRKDVFIG